MWIAYWLPRVTELAAFFCATTQCLRDEDDVAVDKKALLISAESEFVRDLFRSDKRGPDTGVGRTGVPRMKTLGLESKLESLMAAGLFVYLQFV